MLANSLHLVRSFSNKLYSNFLWTAHCPIPSPDHPVDNMHCTVIHQATVIYPRSAVQVSFLEGNSCMVFIFQIRYPFLKSDTRNSSDGLDSKWLVCRMLPKSMLSFHRRGYTFLPALPPDDQHFRHCHHHGCYLRPMNSRIQNTAWLLLAIRELALTP